MKNYGGKMEKTKSYGIASMITGGLSLVLFLAPYFGLPLAILALVFNYQQKKTNPNGYGMAGQVMGIIGIVINAIMLIIVLLALLFMSALKSI